MAANGTNSIASLPASYLAEDRSPQLLSAAITFGILEPLFFVLFLIARILNKTVNGLDFWLMPFAFLFSFSHIPFIVVFARHAGAGRHLVTVSPAELSLWLKLIFAEEWLYIFSVTLPKLAILALYQRLFVTEGQRFYRWAVITITVLMGLNIVADVVLTLVTCRPIAYNWDLTIPGGYCDDKSGPYRWVSLPNIITDILVLVLPMHVIWKLQIGRINKIGLIITFLTGSIGIVASIVRFTAFFAVDLLVDPTYNTTQAMIMTCAEPGVYFIAACLPSLRPLLRIIMHGRVTSELSESSRSRSITLVDSRRPSTRVGAFGSISKHKQAGFGIVKETNIEITHGSSTDVSRLIHDNVQMQHKV